MSVLSVLNKLAPATDTTTTRLKLGDFQFTDFEIPERLSIPARQKTMTHQMIGGKRVIDVFGVEYDAFSWSGLLAVPMPPRVLPLLSACAMRVNR